MIYAALSPILGENIVHYMHYGKYSTVQHFHLVWLHTIHTFLGADVDGSQISTMGTHTHLELHL